MEKVWIVKWETFACGLTDFAVRVCRDRETAVEQMKSMFEVVLDKMQWKDSLPYFKGEVEIDENCECEWDISDNGRYIGLLDGSFHDRITIEDKVVI